MNLARTNRHAGHEAKNEKKQTRETPCENSSGQKVLGSSVRERRSDDGYDVGGAGLYTNLISWLVLSAV